jgi:hypothetical protein
MISKMRKKEAVEKIKRQIGSINNLKDFSGWKRDTEILIEHIFGIDSRHIKEFQNISYSLSVTTTKTTKEEFTQAFRGGLEKGRKILESMIREIEEYWEEPDMNQLVISYLNNIELICNRFDSVARQLQIRHSKRKTIEIDDEYDVQDLFHALLTLYFDDIRDEECTPSYAGGASRVDFLLKKEQTVIEIKKTSEKLTDKEVGKQLMIDITCYKSHPDCKTLICFVYDPERKIKNPRGIENDLSKTTDGLPVKVFIRPL